MTRRPERRALLRLSGDPRSHGVLQPLGGVVLGDVSDGKEEHSGDEGIERALEDTIAKFAEDPLDQCD